MSPVLRHSALAFLIAAAFGLALVVSIFRIENSRLQTFLDQELSRVTTDISRHLVQGTTLLHATHAFLESRTADISRERFSSYVRSLQMTGVKAGLHGIGFAQELTDENRADAQMRLERDYDVTAPIWPADKTAPLSAIVLLEPSTVTNRRALGFDMMSEPLRQAAMSAAKENPGLIYITAPITLVQETQAHAGFLYYLYLGGSPQERGMPRGWVYAPIRAPELFRTSFSDTRSSIEILVMDKGAPQIPLYRSSGYSAHEKGLRSTSALALAGREWELFAHYRGSQAFHQRYPFTLLSAALMFITAVATAVAVSALSQAAQKANRLAETRAQLMRDKDLYLREMSHRIKNSLTRIMAMARQAARGSESKEEFVASMNARLLAMSNAQDVMLRDGNSDLHSLLKVEIDQILMDKTKVLQALEGPATTLTAREAQALGLAVHELATNALKYGAGAIEGASLAVKWSLEPSPIKGKRLLKLVWDEQTNIPSQPPTKKGFGSQLLDSCIKMELGGKITRDYHEKGLTLQLEAYLDNP